MIYDVPLWVSVQVDDERVAIAAARAYLASKFDAVDINTPGGDLEKPIDEVRRSLAILLSQESIVNMIESAVNDVGCTMVSAGVADSEIKRD